MAKSRDRGGRQDKKKKKPKKQAQPAVADFQLRHHSVVTVPAPEPAPEAGRSGE
jgi:hypothetical protein